MQFAVGSNKWKVESGKKEQISGDRYQISAKAKEGRQKARWMQGI